MVQRLRFAVRMLRHAPGFTLAAVVCLACGIGASNSAMRSVESVRIPITDNRDLTSWQLRGPYDLA
jgi:hypothetical protein